MKYINFLFHIYQPPVQSETALAQIVRKSYDPLLRQIAQYPNLKFTLNINYCLVELLLESFPHLVRRIREVHDQGILELTETGAYHPTFPLIPLREVKRQIEINNREMRKVLSSHYNPKGVFPPELAFAGRLVPLFKSLGYRWTMADDCYLQYYGSEVPYDKIYTFDGLAVFLRNNFWSNQLANYHGQWANGQDFVTQLADSLESWMGKTSGYAIIALDGETFGHHHPELGERFLSEMFAALSDAAERLQTVHEADLYREFPHTPHFIPPGSWSTDAADVQRRDYFSWWNSDQNRIHELQWKFTNFVLEMVRGIQNDEINLELDRSLYSCQYWWASHWKFSPEEIYKGAFNMMQILQKAADILDDQYYVIKPGEAIFRQLVTEIEKRRNGVEA